MSWRSGEQAKCIDVRDIRLKFGTSIHRGGQFLRLGMIYPVNAVFDGPLGHQLLDVSAQHGPKLACRFEKVPPLSDEAIAASEVEA